MHLRFQSDEQVDSLVSLPLSTVGSLSGKPGFREPVAFGHWHHHKVRIRPAAKTTGNSQSSSSRSWSMLISGQKTAPSKRQGAGGATHGLPHHLDSTGLPTTGVC